MERAFSILDVKSIEDDKRIVTGFATTPAVDRMGDIIESKGAEFNLPIPLLWQHDANKPIGHVVYARVTSKGIEIKAQIERETEPGALKDRLDEAWQSIKKGLVRGLSIGFKGLETARLEDGSGIRFLKWLWLELSAVTIPANQDASIQTVKQICTNASAATGSNGERASSPGDTGKPKLPVRQEARSMSAKKSIAEQVSAWEATRAAKSARMAEIMDEVSDKGETLDQEAKDEYDGISDELKEIDDHLKRLRDLEEANIAKAVPAQGHSVKSAADNRQGNGGVRVDVRSTLPKGTSFTRYVMAMAAARGIPGEALKIAEKWDSQTPEVSAYIRHVHYGQKADPGMVLAPGGSPATWGAELVYPTNLASEFVELLYPATLLGRMTGFRNVPFNIRVGVQDGGSTVNWVGEAQPKPVTELSFTEALLTHSKIAGIVVLTEELVRLSSPAAEATVRTDLVNSVAKFIDEQMLTASITATANRPASLTNGVSAIPASGYDADALYIDINNALAAYDDADTGTSNVHIIMTPALARAIATMRAALGQFEFGGMGPNGGTLVGFPVLVSNSAPDDTIVFVKTDEVWLADDGGVTIDASREATLDMAGGSTPTFSLYQKNCVAIRAERWIRWQKRRAVAVQLISGALYNPAGTSPA